MLYRPGVAGAMLEAKFQTHQRCLGRSGWADWNRTDYAVTRLSTVTPKNQQRHRLAVFESGDGRKQRALL